MHCVAILALSTLAFASADLGGLVDSGRLEDLRWPDFSDFRDTACRLYQRSANAPVWSRNGAITPQALAMIAILQEAKFKGLDPEDYDASRWRDRLVHPDLLRFDVALTVSVLRYASDLRVGKFNPGIYSSGFDIHHEHEELADLVRRLANTADPRAALLEIEPRFPQYRRAQEALCKYLALASIDSAEKLPAAKLPIASGDKYAGLPRLASLLRLLGDLQDDTPDSDTYKEPLIAAVKRFQLRHGLTPDGRLGKDTLAQLNTPLAIRVRQLELSLERWRWIPHEFAHPAIVVNIPEFKLRAFDESRTTALEMKIVAGNAYHRKTPVFTADLQYVIFHPYWNVPPSITRNELLPHIARDADYLSKNGYEVVTRDDRVVTNGRVDDETIKKLRAGTLSIRQVPGPKNSLGGVKFLFPNEHNVYLHATPATQLFAQSRRDFSHGCIRVEKPELLAQWLLPDWTPDRIREAMSGPKTLQVNLTHPIAVLIVYATAIVLDNGEVRFFDDIYGFDAQLDALAAKGYPCCQWDATSAARGQRPRE